MASAQLPKSMKAFVLEEFGKPYVVRDLPLPDIEHPDDVLIRVEAGSYCHTDAVMAAGTMHASPPFLQKQTNKQKNVPFLTASLSIVPSTMIQANGDPQPPTLPHVGCHEYAGTVVALAPQNPRSHGLKVGDRVAVSGRGYHVCERCQECRNPSGPLPDEPGFSVYCPYTHGGLGVHGPGGFREYAIVDSKQVSLIPDELKAIEVAPLMCAGLTIYAALIKCNLELGQRVGIIGCGGGLGHLGLQFATKMGLKTLGVDVAPNALQLARDLNTGAHVVDAVTIDPDTLRKQMGKEDCQAHISEMGLDAVLILPESQQSFDYGINLLRHGGLAVVVSFPADGFRMQAADLVFRRIRMEGTLIGSNRAMKEMFEFCVKHNVRAKITTYPFLKVNELVEGYESGIPGKLVFDVSQKE